MTRMPNFATRSTVRTQGRADVTVEAGAPPRTRVARFPALLLRTLLCALTLVPCGIATATAADAGGKPAEGARAPRRLGQYSGFEGRELELGRAVAAALRAQRPDGAPADGVDPRYDFSGREEMLGLAMTQVVRTLNHNQSYQHEMNDALVKLTLDHIMFAKRHGMLRQMVEEDVNSQRQQLERVRRLIERGGSRDLALVAIFEQTSCFFQLVDRTQRASGRIAWRSPYRRVLEQTVRMGLHDLTEREIHEVWTVPRLQAYARILGVDLEISPWREDGELSVSVRGGA